MSDIKFVTYSESANYPESGFGGMGGFFDNGMRWKDYLKIWKEEYHSDLENLRTAIVENKIRFTGEQHQNGTQSCPVFTDGTCATYSYRAWGDLMAAVWSEHDDEDYSYMSFYM